MAGETNIFQIGQKVKLSTGGPEMCVEDIQGNACVCRWFVNGSDKSGRFVDQLSLIHISEPTRPY